jgi:aspartate/methionine/tyrosine aminotransferase
MKVYRELEHSPVFAIPAFADGYENGFSLSVMFKSYGLGGLRIDWLTTHQQDILEQIAILKEYTTICSSAPIEFLAGVILRNRAVVLKRNLEIVQTNIPLLNSFFDSYSDLFSWYQLNAEPISFVRMNFG